MLRYQNSKEYGFSHKGREELTPNASKLFFLGRLGANRSRFLFIFAGILLGLLFGRVFGTLVTHSIKSSF